VMVGADTPSVVQKLLEAWYRAEAKRIFSSRMAACFPRLAHLQVAYPTLSVRRMKARWGSCSSTGNIILNLKLIHLPLECIDYVIVHELCHLKEHNHSKRYYRLLEQILPDWRERRAALNAFSA
jgi:predicted metal-dependent hydrolase